MSLSKPYYQDEWAVIYNADCRKILPELGRFDLLLTDPPYGIGRSGKEVSTSSHGGTKGYWDGGWDDSRPDWFFPHVGKVATAAIIWGGNYFADLLPPNPKWLVWDKGQAGQLSQADAELAWTNILGPVRVKVVNRCKIKHDGAAHPTQKPPDVMLWCLSLVPTARTVFDPFMGSGTTLVAAKLAGRQSIGIEIEERYCAIAVERLRQEILLPV